MEADIQEREERGRSIEQGELDHTPEAVEAWAAGVKTASVGLMLRAAQPGATQEKQQP